ncbi:transporter [Xanthobacter agilis]|uniref:transporter n=1 Tax=Xanthobacter agilis TaxID=47492 RepID=UPI00372B6580
MKRFIYAAPDPIQDHAAAQRVTPKRSALATMRRRAATVTVAFTLLACGEARAVDVNASDYVPVPAGTNLLLYYAQYATRSEYISTSGVGMTRNTGLDSYVNILRYVHYFDVAGFTVAPEVLIPAGTLYNGRIGGVELDSAAGFGDPIVAVAFWMVNNKATQTYIGITPYLFVPVGQYNPAAALNIGENRWKLDTQAGWYQGLGNGLSFQITGDAIWYGDNTGAGSGSQVLSQDTTFQFQFWLSYSFADTWQASIGYSKYWGGNEFLNGRPTGNATERDQARFELSTFITPTFQVLGLIQRDFNTSGGFPEDFRSTLRLMQVF